MASKKELRLERLRKDLLESYRSLREFRDHYKGNLRQYVGNRYGQDSAKKPIYINKLALAANIYTMMLSGSMPRASITAERLDLRPEAHRLQLAVNNLLAAIQYDETDEEITKDAFFSVGIAKVCLVEGLELQLAPDITVDPGRPYIGRVSILNYVHDMAQTDYRQIRFQGDMYAVPYEAAMQFDGFKKMNRDKLEPNDKSSRGQGPDDERPGNELSYGHEMHGDRSYLSTVNLWDIWFPKERVVRIYDEKFQYELMTVEYEGPDLGPYHLLTFDDVPDNTMPISPCNQLRELNDYINRTMRKISKQTGRMKDVNVYEGGAENDAKRHKNAEDGDYIRVNNIQSLGTIRSGGPDQQVIGAFVQALGLFNTQSGNIESQAGLAPQAETLGQEEIINNAVGSFMGKRQQRKARFNARVYSDLGWLLWDHPTLNVPGTLDLGPVKLPYDWPERDDFGQKMTRGQFHDFSFSVVPITMQHQTPAQKVQKLLAYLERVSMYQQDRMQQGNTINWHKVDRFVMENENMPELAEISEWQQPLIDRPEGTTGASHGAYKPPTTTRNVVRHNRSGMSSQGRDNALMVQSFGGQPQGAGVQTAQGAQ